MLQSRFKTDASNKFADWRFQIALIDQTLQNDPETNTIPRFYIVVSLLKAYLCIVLLGRCDDDYSRRTEYVLAAANCKIELNYKEIVFFSRKIDNFIV